MRSYKLIVMLMVLAGTLVSPALRAQVQLVTSDYFPGDQEFKELVAIQQDKQLTDPALLAKLTHGPILIELGIRRYAARSYALDDPGRLVVEIYTLGDSRGAYSYLSMLAGTTAQPGPPGDFIAPGSEALLFTAGNYFVAMHGATTDALLRRVATSIANRIGRREPSRPILLSHIPAEGCDPSSIRYFLGPLSIAAFGAPIAGAPPAIPSDVEAVQARCGAQEQGGTITILSFPTIPLAEDYFATGAVYDRPSPGGAGIYTRQTGPLVGILEGNISPEVADKTLGSIKFSYSVKWIYDRTRNRGQTLWGVPVRILGTVVRSLMFTALLCVVSVLAGVMIAAGRVYLRRRLGREDDSGYIRLKMN
jgi:hypothetical protein